MYMMFIIQTQNVLKYRIRCIYSNMSSSLQPVKSILKEFIECQSALAIQSGLMRMVAANELTDELRDTGYNALLFIRRLKDEMISFIDSVPNSTNIDDFVTQLEQKLVEVTADLSANNTNNE